MNPSLSRLYGALDGFRPDDLMFFTFVAPDASGRDTYKADSIRLLRQMHDDITLLTLSREPDRGYKDFRLKDPDFRGVICCEMRPTGLIMSHHQYVEPYEYESAYPLTVEREWETGQMVSYLSQALDSEISAILFRLTGED